MRCVQLGKHVNCKAQGTIARNATSELLVGNASASVPFFRDLLTVHHFPSQTRNL